MNELEAIIAEMTEPENSGQFGPWQITRDNIKDWRDRLAAYRATQVGEVEPAAWYVELVAPGYRDNGTKIGPFWKLKEAQDWCDDSRDDCKHVLRALYHNPSSPPVAQVGEVAALAAEYTRGRNDGWEACEAKCLSEAALAAAIHSQYPATTEYDQGYGAGRKDASLAIRDLAARTHPSSPAGDWLLVPVEPTEAMLKATEGMEFSVLVDEDFTREYPVSDDDCAEIYRNMLAAAPQPPGQEKAGV